MKALTQITIAVYVLSTISSYAQPCFPITVRDLDINNVRARIINGSDKWWDPSGGVAMYEVPKGGNKSSMFAAAIWIGGMDANGQLHLAAQTYRQTAIDFWSGPVQKNGCTISTDTGNCPAYEHIWEFTPADISNFLSSGTATADMLSYPANGNIANGELPVLAPFFDSNSNGIYEPALGDYPLMDVNNTIPDSAEQLFGDQCLYWIFNDTSFTPLIGGGPPMGVEIHAQAFSYSSPVNAVNNTTFYRYKIINRTCETYDSVFISHWADPDLGWYNDDFIGCHVEKNLGYGYNGDAVDDLPDGYGFTPPAVGITVLQGPPADPNDGIDNNNNGVTDETGEENLMTKFLAYHGNVNPAIGIPQTSDDYYNYMSGKWLDNTPWTYGGNGYNAGSTDITNFIYPWDSDPSHPNTWNEPTNGNTPGDRTFALSSGPFTFYPDQCVCITYAVVWSRAASGDNISSLDSLLSATDYIRNNFHFYDCPCNNATGTEQIIKQHSDFNIFPNPADQSAILSFSSTEKEPAEITVTDVLGNEMLRLPLQTSQMRLLTSSFPSGIYIIKVFSPSGVFQKKLIVNH